MNYGVPQEQDWNALSDAAFRAVVGAEFETRYPAELRYPPRRLRWHENKSWFLRMAAKGWIAPGWPREYGGMGLAPAKITAAVRTGDTPTAERAAMIRTPPHILVTTPESLYLLLTSERSRNMLRTVRAVIVDEIHAVIESRRGAHLALSLERLAHITGRPLQRIGLSATQKPIDEVARYLGARAMWARRAEPIAPSWMKATAGRSTWPSRFPAHRSNR